MMNNLAADLIAFANARSFESFKQDTDTLNSLQGYPQLLERAQNMGFSNRFAFPRKLIFKATKSPKSFIEAIRQVSNYKKCTTMQSKPELCSNSNQKTKANNKVLTKKTTEKTNRLFRFGRHETAAKSRKTSKRNAIK